MCLEQSSRTAGIIVIIRYHHPQVKVDAVFCLLIGNTWLWTGCYISSEIPQLCLTVVSFQLQVSDSFNCWSRRGVTQSYSNVSSAERQHVEGQHTHTHLIHTVFGGAWSSRGSINNSFLGKPINWQPRSRARRSCTCRATVSNDPRAHHRAAVPFFSRPLLPPSPHWFGGRCDSCSRHEERACE